MSIFFITESNAQYEVRDDRTEIRRCNPDVPKRGDSEWLELIAMAPARPEVGYPVLLVMEPLNGPDDTGDDIEADVTTRRTTPVTVTWEE